MLMANTIIRYVLSNKCGKLKSVISSGARKAQQLENMTKESHEMCAQQKSPNLLNDWKLWAI